MKTNFVTLFFLSVVAVSLAAPGGASPSDSDVANNGRQGSGDPVNVLVEEEVGDVSLPPEVLREAAHEVDEEEDGEGPGPEGDGDEEGAEGGELVGV